MILDSLENDWRPVRAQMAVDSSSDQLVQHDFTTYLRNYRAYAVHESLSLHAVMVVRQELCIATKVQSTSMYHSRH